MVKVITLDNKKFNESVNRLAEKVTLAPDLIIGIETGGKYVLDEFLKHGRFKNTAHHSVKIQRKTTGLKNNKLASYLLRNLPRFAADKLRVAEHRRAKSAIPKMAGDKTIQLDIDLSPYDNILVLDDAIDTGNTAKTLINSLKKQKKSIKIEVGVVCWTIREAIVQPDYYVYSGCIARFPWSKDFKKFTRND